MVLKSCLVLRFFTISTAKKRPRPRTVADGSVLCFQGFELGAHIGLQFRRALNKFKPLHLFDGGNCRSSVNGCVVGVAGAKVASSSRIGCGGTQASGT